MVRVEPWSSEFEHLVTVEDLAAVKAADRAWAIFAGDELGAVVGIEIYSIASNSAFLWMLPYPAINNNRLAAARLSRKFVREMRKNFSLIYGMVLCENEVSKKWLWWLGFELLPPEKNLMYFYTRTE